MTEHDGDLETIELAGPPPPPPPPPTEPPGPPPGGGGSSDPAARAANHVRAFVVALIVTMLVAGLGAFAITSHFENNSDSHASTTVPAPGGVVPRTPGSSANHADPDESVLSHLGVQQVDVALDYSVQVITNGDQVTGTVTLDVCNGNYPSESLRTARLQVVEVDAFSDSVLSTEAVLYRNPAATVQAFQELRDRARNCPRNRPVQGPDGAVTTKFNAAPDVRWPRVRGVERLAFDMNTTDAQGNTDHSIAVYLRRGRALLGVYFPHPDGPQPPVVRNTTVQSIVGLFEARMARLPDFVVNRG